MTAVDVIEYPQKLRRISTSPRVNGLPWMSRGMILWMVDWCFLRKEETKPYLVVFPNMDTSVDTALSSGEVVKLCTDVKIIWYRLSWLRNSHCNDYKLPDV